MKKRIISLVLVLGLILTANVITFASSNDTDFKPSKFGTEIIRINDKSVSIDRYYDNGFIVETVTLPEEITLTQEEISEALYILDLNKQTQSQISPLAHIDEYHEFDDSKPSQSNGNCRVRHWGTFVNTYEPYRNIMKIVDGACRGTYSAGNAKKIQLSETYDFRGLTLSVSWPAGVSIGSSNNIGTWSSLAYENTSMATAYRPDLEGSVTMFIAGNFKATVTSRSDIYIGSSSYGASVSTQNVYTIRTE